MMKVIKITVLCLVYLFFSIGLYGQDTLDVDKLSTLTSYFTIEDGKFRGDGAEFLMNEIEKAQFTILGDYPNSQMISTFVKILLPELNQLNYKTMVVDVGPVAANIISQLPLCNKNITSTIKSLNNRYGFKEEDRNHLPIPALSSVEEADNLAYAIDQNWKLVGLNNDSWNSLSMLLDELYYNLSDVDKDRLFRQYKNASADLILLYQNRGGDLISFAEDFDKNSSIQAFLQSASKEEKNKSIIKSINYSLVKSGQYAQKAYFEKNRDRIPYEKAMLREQLALHDFDINEDKLLVKVYRRHAAKGFQPDGFYGFANTLYEMASYNGNKSVHIGFFKRFYMENGVVKDEMDSDYYLRNRYKDMIQMGQENQWTIIDLRPLMEGSYYSSKYVLSSWIQDLMKQYDLIIIPPIDIPLTPNHELTHKK